MSKSEMPPTDNPIVLRSKLIDKVDSAAQELDEKHPKVTERQKELAASMLVNSSSIATAAEAVGMSAASAYDALKKPWVAAYMRDLAGLVLGVNALRAAAVTADLLDARSERVRLEAANSILSRAGIEPDSGASRPIQVAIKL